MESVSKDAFIETTLETQKNEKLENAINESKARISKIKEFANSDNTIVKIITWFLIMIILFFAFPIILTGLLTKGMRKTEQQMIWTAILILVTISFLKNSLF